MSQNVELRCRCGTVHGVVTDVSPHTVNRVGCYCDDCQAFLHQLGRADLLDAHGGSDVVQVAPASLSFQRGLDHIAGLRLAPKGLNRWYARCCNTPLGNTLAPNIPFVGIITQVFPAGNSGYDGQFGALLGAVRGEFAIGTPPEGTTGFSLHALRVIGRSFGKVIGWRLGGRAWPHPFFDQNTREPRYPIQTLTIAEREALRPLCGPKPTAGAAAQTH